MSEKAGMKRRQEEGKSGNGEVRKGELGAKSGDMGEITDEDRQAQRCTTLACKCKSKRHF